MTIKVGINGLAVSVVLFSVLLRNVLTSEIVGINDLLTLITWHTC